MASSGVELHITAETGKAAQQLGALLSKMDAMQEKLDATGSKGKSAFEGMGKYIAGLATSFAAPATAIRALLETLELIEKKMAAVRREQTDSAAVAKTYGEALQQITMNGGAANIGKIDSFLRETSAKYGLGEQGPQKLAQAFGQVQARGGDMPLAQQQELTKAVAQMGQANPNLDMGQLAGAAASMSNAAGGKLNPTQIMTLLQQTPRQGRVSSLGAVGSATPDILQAGRAGGMAPQDAASVAATVSRLGGEAMMPKVGDFIGRMTYGSEKLEEDLNTEKKYGHEIKTPKSSADYIHIGKDPFATMAQLTQLRQSGKLSQEKMDNLFPMLGRGMGLRNVADQFLTPEGQSLLGQTRAANAPGLLNHSLSEEDQAILEKAVPTVGLFTADRREASADAARRAGDVSAVGETMQQNNLRRRLKGGEATDEQMKNADLYFTQARKRGLNPEQAQDAAIRESEAREMPVLGKAAQIGELVTGGKMQVQAVGASSASGTGNGFDSMARYLQQIAENTAPGKVKAQRPLNADGAAGR